MGEWLKIHRDKGKDSAIANFIQANPNLDIIMTNFLANHFMMNESTTQSWIQAYLKPYESKFAI